MKRQTTISVLLVCGAAAALVSAQPLPPECSDVVQVVLAPNPYHPNGGGRCDVAQVTPDPVVVCPGGTITWEFENRCAHKVKARIGKRRPKYPKDAHGEPLTRTDHLKPSPYPLAAHGKASVTAQVEALAKERKYKYDIAGDNDIETDPEIEVRRGGRKPIASPSP